MSQYFRYLRKKLIWYLITFFVLLALNFFLPRLMPGNPVDIILSSMGTSVGDTATMKRVYDSFITEFHLDKPMLEQFFIFIGNLFRGSLGTSFVRYPRPVASIIGEALPWTLALMIPAIAVGWIVGNTLGAVTAYRKGLVGKGLYPLSLFLYSIPYQAFAIMIMYFFSIVLKWFPSGGGYSMTLMPSLSFRFISDAVRHHTLPFSAITLVMIGGQALGMRSMSIYELNADYVLYSQLMGVGERRISLYVFRNAMLPQVSGLALALGTMVTGSLITEIVFNYPGIGYWLFSAIRQTDYPLISGCTLMVSITVLLANFLIDIVYGLLDPRIKAAQLEEQ